MHALYNLLVIFLCIMLLVISNCYWFSLLPNVYLDLKDCKRNTPKRQVAFYIGEELLL